MDTRCNSGQSHSSSVMKPVGGGSRLDYRHCPAQEGRASMQQKYGYSVVIERTCGSESSGQVTVIVEFPSLAQLPFPLLNITT